MLTGNSVEDVYKRQGVESVKIRSVLTCDTKIGVCGHCYGREMCIRDRPIPVRDRLYREV